jgi:hypothetical protein
MSAIFTEYAWDVGWCDPCSSDPLTNNEFRLLGAHWLHGKGAERPEEGQLFVTRLHVRYDAAHFPEDLVFQQTGDRENFQVTCVLRHPWKGKATCEAAKKYFAAQPKEREAEMRTLARLTGWEMEAIRGKAEKYVDRAKRP